MILELELLYFNETSSILEKYFLTSQPKVGIEYFLDSEQSNECIDFIMLFYFFFFVIRFSEIRLVLSFRYKIKSSFYFIISKRSNLKISIPYS